MGLWNIRAKCHSCPKSAAFANFWAISMSTVVKITLKNGSYFYLLESYFCSFDLEIDVLTLKLTWNHENNTRNGFSSQKYTKRVITLVPRYISYKYHIWPWKSYFHLIDLDIYALTLKMTFNHQNSTTNWFFSQKHIRKRYYTLLIFVFVKNYIFAVLSLYLTFWPWWWP